MTRSSKSRKSRAKTKKRLARTYGDLKHGQSPSLSASMASFSSTDKRYFLGFAVLSLLITIGYWTLGGRNLFVFPALFCIAVGVRSYWSGPLRKFANDD